MYFTWEFHNLKKWVTLLDIKIRKKFLGEWILHKIRFQKKFAKLVQQEEEWSSLRVFLINSQFLEISPVGDRRAICERSFVRIPRQCRVGILMWWIYLLQFKLVCIGYRTCIFLYFFLDGFIGTITRGIEAFWKINSGNPDRGQSQTTKMGYWLKKFSWGWTWIDYICDWKF